LGYGHDPDGVAALGSVVVVDCVVVAVGVLEPQAAASKAARTASRLSPMRVRSVRLEAGMAPPPLT
jgi:hypothetical protein